MARSRTGTSSQRTRRREICDAIRQRIFEGDLPPGTRLLQLELAREYQVGQGAIREALLELKGCGLVDEVENLGMFACQLDEDELIQNLEVRAVLEGLAARLCCDKVSPRDLKELRDVAEAIREHRAQDQVLECSTFGRRFHQRITEIADNTALERLSLGVRSAVMDTPVMRDNPMESYQEHLAILEALENNQPAEAERRAREHVERSREAILQAIRSGTYTPQWIA